MIPPTPQALLDQVAAAIWSTDADLMVTRCRVPWLPTSGVAADRLVGMSLHRLIEGRPFEEVIDAHCASLMGRVAAFDITWGDRRFVGRTSPLRDAAGAVVGVAGVSLETGLAAADALDLLDAHAAGWPERRSAPSLCVLDPSCSTDDVLADVCLSCGWYGGLLWQVGDDGRLTSAGRFGLSTADEQSVEPYAWVAATGDGQQWVETPGLTLVPLRAGVSGRRFVLGLLRAEDAPEPAQDVDRTAALLAIALAPSARRAVVARPRLVATAGATLKLALCLIPLPFIVSACFPPP